MNISPSHILLAILAGTILVQLYFYLFAFTKILRDKSQKTKAGKPVPVSVIVACRNKSPQLEEYLVPFLEQKHPSFELIVIDEESNDDSEFVLEALKKKYAHLKVLYPHQNDSVRMYSRKFSLSLGVKAAKFDHVLFVNFYSLPENKNWLSSISAAKDESEFVAIAAKSFKPVGKWQELLQSCDSLLEQMKIFNFNLGKAKYVASNCNYLFPKALFLNNRGFAPFTHLKVGEHFTLSHKMLQLSQLNKVVSNSDATLYVPAEKSFLSFLKQLIERRKLMHLLSSPIKWKLRLFNWTKRLAWILFAALLLLNDNVEFAIYVFGSYFVIVNIINVLNALRLSHKSAVWFIPIYEILNNVLGILTYPITRFRSIS